MDQVIQTHSSQFSMKQQCAPAILPLSAKPPSLQVASPLAVKDEGSSAAPNMSVLQSSRENSANSISLLAGLEEFLENSAVSSASEIFLLTYRGSSEVDRHYTKPMLPWIIAEIKNQNKFEKVKVEISQGMVNVRYFSNESLLFSHSVKQIHKCVMEQADHTHFLYTLKPSQERDSNGSKLGRSFSMQQQLDLYPPLPVPANTTASTDHHCHLFKAETEQDVRNFFRCLREQPRDPHQMFRANSQSCHSLSDLSLHNDSQFYEVLFVGRVKVSHSRVPSSFIDEACEAFKNKQKTRPRIAPSTESMPSVASYQTEGSDNSVANTVSVTDDPHRDRSCGNARDLNKGEFHKQSHPSGHQHRVRFTLDTNIDQRLRSHARDDEPSDTPARVDDEATGEASAEDHEQGASGGHGLGRDAGSADVCGLKGAMSSPTASFSVDVESHNTYKDGGIIVKSCVATAGKTGKIEGGAKHCAIAGPSYGQTFNDSVVARLDSSSFAEEASLPTDSAGFGDHRRVLGSHGSSAESIFSNPKCSSGGMSFKSDTTSSESFASSSDFLNTFSAGEDKDESGGSTAGNTAQGSIQDFSIRVPEKVNWYLPSEDHLEKACGSRARSPPLPFVSADPPSPAPTPPSKLVRQHEFLGASALEGLEEMRKTGLIDLAEADEAELHRPPSSEGKKNPSPDIAVASSSSSACNKFSPSPHPFSCATSQVPIPLAPSRGILHSPEAPSSPDKSCHSVKFDSKIFNYPSSTAQSGDGAVGLNEGDQEPNRQLLEKLLARRCSDQFASVGVGEPTPEQVYYSLTRAASIAGNAAPPVSLFTALSITSMSGDHSSGGSERRSTSPAGPEVGGSDMEMVEPFRQRLRTISGGSSPLKLKRSQVTESPMRARTGSIGSMMTRPRLLRHMSESELKMASRCEFNRTMLFHIGREELQLINPEFKSVQLHKSFKDVPQRCQGILNKDHFGFICREVAGEVPVYVGYVFRCDNADVTTEIIQSLNKSIEAVQSVYQKEKLESSMCDSCPMRWFSSLCSEVEGLPAVRAHGVIMKRVHQLPEADRDLLLAKYEGADTPEVHRKNNVLMMLLRAQLESEQQGHVHSVSGLSKGPESSLNRVKKSLATSFQHLLKREEGVGDGGLARRAGSPVVTHPKVRLENLSESPLSKGSLPPGHRPRSSTLSAAGGDSMRRELRSTLQRAISNQANPLTAVGGHGSREGAVQGTQPPQQSIAAGRTSPKAAAKTAFTLPGSVDTNGSNENTIAGRVNTAASGGGSVQDGQNLKSFTGSVGGISSQTPDVILTAKQQLPLMNNNNQQELGQGLVTGEKNGGGRGEGSPVKMSREVEDEVFGSVKPLARNDEEKENVPQRKVSRPKMDIFLKVGSPGRCTSPSGDSGDLETSPSTSFRHAILQRVISPAKPEDSTSSMQSALAPSAPQQDGSCPQQKMRRQWPHLRLLWRRAVFRQMLLIRIGRVAQQTRALEEELELQRVCLSYDEEPVEEDVLQTWQLVLSRPYNKIDQTILYAGVRHGVPKSLRGEIWHLLVSQHRRYQPQRINQSHLPSHFDKPYEEMIKGLTSQQHAILIDLGRTFPRHPYFTRTLGPGQLGLFNLLKAYSLLDKEVGYCQGLSFVAGILIMHVNEETAYLLLKHLMYVAGVRRQFRQDLDGLQVQMYQLSRLLHDRLRAVYTHLEESDISPQLYAAPWFLTLFASSFPLHFVVRLYDMLFLVGLEAVFRISLLLLTEHEADILACDGFEETMDYLKTVLPAVPVDRVEELFEMAFAMNLSEQLSAYELEYQVLREELCVTPPHQQASLNKLAEEKKTLKRQNLDLVEQLQNAQAQKHALEASNQMLQQSQHHLEVRVRFLEVERNNLKQVVEQLWKVGLQSNPDLASFLPPGLLRYLPSHSSSPKPLDRRELAKIELEGANSLSNQSIRSLMTQEGRLPSFRSNANAGDHYQHHSTAQSHVDAVKLLGDAGTGATKGSVAGGDATAGVVAAASGGRKTVPPSGVGGGDRLTVTGVRTSTGSNIPPSSDPSLCRKKSPSPDIGLFGSRASSTSSKPAKPESESLFPPFNFPSLNFSRDSAPADATPHRARSSTLDHGSMQRFVRGLTRNN